MGEGLILLEGAGTNFTGPLAFDLGLKDMRHISLGRDGRLSRRKRTQEKMISHIYINTYFRNIYIHGLKI